MPVSYSVHVTGQQISTAEMRLVISDYITKKKLSIDTKTLDVITESIMRYLYKLNMEAGIEQREIPFEK